MCGVTARWIERKGERGAGPENEEGQNEKEKENKRIKIGESNTERYGVE